VAYRERPDAGAVCRRFGVSRPTLRKWLRRYEAEGEVGLRALSRRPHHFPAQKVDEALQAAILDLRRARRLGAKRLRNELQRLHGVRLSAATVHKVLVQHGLNVLPTRKRSRHKPKRYSRPVPGDRVQMDTCKIRPGYRNAKAADDIGEHSLWRHRQCCEPAPRSGEAAALPRRRLRRFVRSRLLDSWIGEPGGGALCTPDGPHSRPNGFHARRQDSQSRDRRRGGA